MGYLLAGVIILFASIVGLWISLPTADGSLKPFLKNGIDVWVALAVTGGVVSGFGSLVFGVIALVN